jgi:hypothetical protein
VYIEYCFILKPVNLNITNESLRASSCHLKQQQGIRCVNIVNVTVLFLMSLNCLMSLELFSEFV